MRPRRALPGGRLRTQLDTNLRGAVLRKSYFPGTTPVGEVCKTTT
jgi:hypothetical protein